MAKGITRKSDLSRSYNSYRRQYLEWERRGYAMSPIQSKEEYIKNYQKAKDVGVKRIADTFASESREFTRSEVVSLRRNLAQQLQGRDVIAEIEVGEARYATDTERRLLSNKTREIIGASRKDVFNALLSLGLTFKEAEKVMYGD